ncbi:uncharacterized protein LOC113464677 isoform X2 [Ceratina calcarata]|uniref:Uncharacterized protein LOC113464677 isoform X2 n=1 Tax=Ceratina calcarata TaxID=156304 RepID=A0AAJ7S5Z0_9HYME|nr:uncharacterized protein LOC113464677 isoform X2 [Ceratina calcarata]
MLKHILTGQPSSTGSRHQHNDYQASSGSLHGGHHHHHHSGHQQDQQQQQHHHYNQTSNIRGTQGRGVDVYDSVIHQRPTVHHQTAATPSSTHRHPLNHSQLSVNNLSQRLNHSHALNLSTLSTSKHSVNSVSPIAGGINNNNNNNVSTALGHTVVTQVPGHQDTRPKVNGGFDISRLSRLPSQATPSPAPALQGTAISGQLPSSGGCTAFPLNASWSSSLSRNHKDCEAGAKETLTSLGLLCLVSLLLALLSLIFLLKISPLTVTPSSLISPEEYTIVYEVTLALCALALSLNLCCLLVCAIQFLFTVKLVKTSYQGHCTTGNNPWNSARSVIEKAHRSQTVASFVFHRRLGFNVTRVSGFCSRAVFRASERLEHRRVRSYLLKTDGEREPATRVSRGCSC